MVTVVCGLRAGAHRTLRRRPLGASCSQRGVVLLEVLIAVLIFSLGVLGIVGLQAQSIRHVNDAQYRSEAIFLANAFISQMWSDDRTASSATYLADTYSDSSGGTGYVGLKEMVKTLPGSTMSTNWPKVTVQAGPSATSTLVTVTLFWQLPGESTPHNYTTAAILGRNP